MLEYKGRFGTLVAESCIQDSPFVTWYVKMHDTGEIVEDVMFNFICHGISVMEELKAGTLRGMEK